jgi:tetratricopeptide (TPR) repeat protein
MNSKQPLDTASSSSAGDRLDSWKEIAVYLRRDVRTVQRWHERAGLPVHRHIDAKQRGVFAFRGELDAWANRSRSAIPDECSPVQVPERARRPAFRWLAAAGVSVLVVTGLWMWAWQARIRSHTPPPFRDDTWVLVARVDTGAADPGLEDSLQFALERELSASPSIRVVARPRVQDVLRLMRRPDATPLTGPVAREVALRDGTVRAIVAGRADRSGSNYVLTLDILDPHTGGVVKSRSTDVAGRGGLVRAVRSLAVWAREALGQPEMPRTLDPRLPQVTTTSLRALQLYAKADDAMMHDHQQASRVLLESALREDPDFAMAHSLLTVVLENEPEARALAPAIVEHEQRALALAPHTTERERLHILGMYQLRHSDRSTALATWEALARIDPDNWFAHDCMAVLYYALRRIPEALREADRAAELRPDNFRIAVRAAQSWVLWGGDPDRARPYVERARALWPAQQHSFSSELRNSNLPPEYARAAAWIFLFPAYERWRVVDLSGMAREIRQVLDSNPLPSPVDRDALLTVAIALDMSAGRLHDARELAQSMFQDGLRELHLAVLADAVDDQSDLRRHMRRVPLEREQRALRYVRAGLYREAESIITRVHDGEGYTDTARGELARRRGRLSEAVQALQHGVDLAANHTLSERYLGAESLAAALERLNRRDEALKVLEAAAAEEPRYTRTGPSGAFWLRVLAKLSEAYRECGRAADAERVDSRLRGLLAAADPDHPLRARLNRVPAN